MESSKTGLLTMAEEIVAYRDWLVGQAARAERDSKTYWLRRAPGDVKRSHVEDGKADMARKALIRLAGWTTLETTHAINQRKATLAHAEQMKKAQAVA